MLKYVGAILGVILFLVCLVYYAARPAGALTFTVANTFLTNSGYVVTGKLQNVGRTPLLLRATNDRPEIAIHVQIAANSFQAGGPLLSPFSKPLLPNQTTPFEVFVPTNATAILMTEYSGKGNSVRRKLRQIIITVYTLGKGRDTGSEVASTYLTPPARDR